MNKLLLWFAAVTTTSLTYCACSLAEDVEYDVCSCKHAQIGAQSTLRGGVCQRTEAGNCLMQWGATSRDKVPSIGKADSQQDAAVEAEELVRRGMKGDFKVVPLNLAGGSLPAPNATPLQIAIGNLARIPPEGYEQPGIGESFVLAAATALVRFDLPVDLLAANLLLERRSQFVSALRTEGSFAAGPFNVKGRTGCLQIDAFEDHVHVYIKTPFARSERC